MLRFNRAKIVATLGPASRSPEMIRRLIAEGVDVFRLNFSHGNHADHRENYQQIRQIADSLGATIAVLQDLQGPKIRIGKIEGVAHLQSGQPFTLTRRDLFGNHEIASITYKALVDDVQPGLNLLLDDGNIRLCVTGVSGDDIHTTVEVGGPLSSNKGINVPGADLSTPALTEKDIDDLRFGAELGVDWVALSFVRTRADLQQAREELQKANSSALLMAKIEKPSAVDRFDDLLDEADGIMVARGDLGVEMPAEDVPVAQKRIINKCVRAGKPVITATQMLESMITKPRPTRAEASDVANAIFDGTDAVMLSGETASGQYPLEAVAIMRKVAERVAASPEFAERLRSMPPIPTGTTPDAIAIAVNETARAIRAKAVIAFTVGGTSAWRIARTRPMIPIVAVTPNPVVRNQLALASGVVSVIAEYPQSIDHMLDIAMKKVQNLGIAKSGDLVVIASGVPFASNSTPNVTALLRKRHNRGATMMISRPQSAPTTTSNPTQSEDDYTAGTNMLRVEVVP